MSTEDSQDYKVSPDRILEYIEAGQPPLEPEEVISFAAEGKRILADIGNRGLRFASPEAAKRYAALSRFATRNTVTDDFAYGSLPDESRSSAAAEDVHHISGLHHPRGGYNSHRRRSRR